MFGIDSFFLGGSLIQLKLYTDIVEDWRIEFIITWDDLMKHSNQFTPLKKSCVQGLGSVL